MTNREAIDGTLAGAGLTMPAWIHALEGWLQLGVVMLSVVLLVYTIRVRRLEIRAKMAQLDSVDRAG